jgi:glycine cleavage system H protein
MPSPDDRRYRETHEWHKLEDGLVVIGVSRFAVDELTDITFFEVFNADSPVRAGEPFGEIESVKTTSELYSGVDGKLVEVNQEVIDNPALVNEDPYGKGWLVKIDPVDDGQLSALMSSEDYDSSHS